MVRKWFEERKTKQVRKSSSQLKQTISTTEQSALLDSPKKFCTVSHISLTFRVLLEVVEREYWQHRGYAHTSYFPRDAWAVDNMWARCTLGSWALCQRTRYRVLRSHICKKRDLAECLPSSWFHSDQTEYHRRRSLPPPMPRANAGKAPKFSGHAKIVSHDLTFPWRHSNKWPMVILDGMAWGLIMMSGVMPCAVKGIFYKKRLKEMLSQRWVFCQ